MVSGAERSRTPVSQDTGIPGPKLFERKRGGAKARLTAYVEPALAERLRIHCARFYLRESDVIAAAVTEFLDSAPHD